MAPNAALKAYQSITKESMAHGGKGAELVTMLYDGIIESLVKAQGHIERKEWRESGHQFARPTPSLRVFARRSTSTAVNPWPTICFAFTTRCRHSSSRRSRAATSSC